MKVLIVGSGGREHTLAWKLKQSRQVDKLFCAPGNGGISRIARCINIKANNIPALADFAARNKIHLTVVGPEQPLADGIVDEFQKRRLKIFGPDRKAAQLESSKIFAKEFMRKYHIPTAPFQSFSIGAEAIGFCKAVQFPIVIKADGLAAGKGVMVAKTFDQAVSSIESIMMKKTLGKAGDRIIVESFLEGQELSVMAFTDGKTIVPMLPSQDHKQAFEGDRGPNTGGMGAYCPTSIADENTRSRIMECVLLPTIEGFKKEGITYRGVIYAGLMITPGGPKVLEYNCRFGDPETQVVLPLLKTDLFELMMAVVSSQLGSTKKLSWRNDYAACVVMASRGYPGKYKTGIEINGLSSKSENGSLIFHAGTSFRDNVWRTSGGRVVGVTGLDSDLSQALGKAYRAVGKIKFEGAMFRKDIGFRVLKKKKG